MYFIERRRKILQAESAAEYDELWTLISVTGFLTLIVCYEWFIYRGLISVVFARVISTGLAIFEQFSVIFKT